MLFTLCYDYDNENPPTTLDHKATVQECMLVHMQLLALHACCPAKVNGWVVVSELLGINASKFLCCSPLGSLVPCLLCTKPKIIHQPWQPPQDNMKIAVLNDFGGGG